MKKFIALFSILIITVTSCDVLNQVGEVSRFAQCDFSIYDVKITQIGNLNVSKYKSASDFGFQEMLSLGQQMLTGDMPAKLSVGIRAKNNQSSKAAISGLQWHVLMKNEEYGSGKLNKYVEVLPGQSTNFTVGLDFDLLKLLKSENLQSLLDLVFDIKNKEKLAKLDILLKVKPYYKVGSNTQEYPGFINIRP